MHLPWLQEVLKPRFSSYARLDGKVALIFGCNNGHHQGAVCFHFLPTYHSAGPHHQFGGIFARFFLF
jgi:hypothetical protein